MTLLLFLLIALVSYFLVYLIRRYAEHRRIIDYPTERSSHITPTPRGGGLAIVVLVAGTGFWSASEAGWNGSLVYLVCGLVIASLGWLDDVHSLSPRVRLAVHGLVATVSVYGLGFFKSVSIPLFGDYQLGVAGVVITFLWIVGLTNAYNFMDGIDGIAGGVALAGGLGWMMLAVNAHSPFAFWIALAIAASSLGFLGHNWHPAKIFMGDVASTFLGYSFSVLPLLLPDPSGDALMLGALLMWTFIIDAGVTFIRRARKREDVWAAHRTHLYQRLVIDGHSQATVSTLYVLLTIVSSLLSFAWSQGVVIAPPLIVLGLPLLWLLLSRHASRLKDVDRSPHA